MNILLMLMALSTTQSVRKIRWFSLLIRGNKIGYTRLEYTTGRLQNKVKELTGMTINMLGSTKKLNLMTESTTDKRWNLKTVNFELKTPDQISKGNALVKKDSLIVFFSAGTGSQKRKAFFRGSLPVFLSSYIYILLDEGKKVPGKFYVFDPSTIDLAKGRITKTQASRNSSVYKYEYGGYSSEISISKNSGIDDKGPMGLETVETDKKTAVANAKEAFDLLGFFAIRPQKPLNTNSKHIRLLLSNINKNLDLSCAAQKVLKRTANSAVVRIDIPDSIPKVADEPPARVSIYLKPTPFMQVDNEKIKNLAMSITKDKETSFDKTKAILDFVYDYLEKSPTVSVPSALDVLNMKKGDCNEHSILFGALARAAGIPTKIVVGLIYQAGAYYYHAWDAVYIAGHWYFVDPIFHQFPASGAHLMLKEGGIDKQGEIIDVVGKLKIKILKQ